MVLPTADEVHTRGIATSVWIAESGNSRACSRSIEISPGAPLDASILQHEGRTWGLTNTEMGSSHLKRRSTPKAKTKCPRNQLQLWNRSRAVIEPDVDSNHGSHLTLSTDEESHHLASGNACSGMVSIYRARGQSLEPRTTACDLHLCTSYSVIMIMM